MKKRILAIMICMLAFSHGVYADFDYSQLDGLSKQELIELRREVTDRLKSYTEGNAEESVQVDLTEGSGWVVKNYQDEFGRDTEKKYITTKSPMTGTYSDKFSDNEPLSAKLYIGEEVYFELYKNGDYLITGVSSNGDDCRIKILLPDGEVFEVLEDLNRSGKIIISPYGSTRDKFFDALLLGEDLKVNFSMYDGTESYSFTIPKCSNLQELYELLFGTIPHTRHGNGETIEVNVSDVELVLNNGIPTVTAKTNLPEGTKMQSRIQTDRIQSRLSYITGSDEAVGADGSVSFSDYRNKIDGYSTVYVIIHLDWDQDDSIRDRLGDNYEMLTGDIAHDLELSTLGYQTIFTIK